MYVDKTLGDHVLPNIVTRFSIAEDLFRNTKTPITVMELLSEDGPELQRELSMVKHKTQAHPHHVAAKLGSVALSLQEKREGSCRKKSNEHTAILSYLLPSSCLYWDAWISCLFSDHVILSVSVSLSMRFSSGATRQWLGQDHRPRELVRAMRSLRSIVFLSWNPLAIHRSGFWG